MANTKASATRTQALENAVKVFDEWRPEVEGVVDDLKQEVGKLNKLKVEVGCLSKHWDSTVVDTSISALGVFASTPTTPSFFVPKLTGDAAVNTKVAVRPPAGSKQNCPTGSTLNRGPKWVNLEWSPL
jgi:hypothetical protein